MRRIYRQNGESAVAFLERLVHTLVRSSVWRTADVGSGPLCSECLPTVPVTDEIARLDTKLCCRCNP